MNNLKFLKEIMIHVTLAFFLLFAVSCDDQRSEDSREVAEEMNDENIENDNKEEDAEFLVDAAVIHLEEIQLGQLAQQRGTLSEIRELGSMMEKDHSKALNDLRSLANSKMVTIPTSQTNKSKDVYNELNEESGEDFDAAYANIMVSKHNDAIDLFEEASTDAYDTEIKNLATTSLPTLRNHLDMSMKLQQKFANMYLENNN